MKFLFFITAKMVQIFRQANRQLLYWERAFIHYTFSNIRETILKYASSVRRSKFNLVLVMF